MRAFGSQASGATISDTAPNGKPFGTRLSPMSRVRSRHPCVRTSASAIRCDFPRAASTDEPRGGRARSGVCWAEINIRKKPLKTLGFQGLLIWLRGLDLNQRPSGYEPDELPGCSTPR